MARKWLVISYFSNVDTLACSHHLDDRIPHLRELGIEPIILGSVCSPQVSDLKKIRIPSIAPSGLRYELRYITRRNFKNRTIRQLIQFPFYLVILPGYLIESALMCVNCTWSWSLSAGLAAAGIAKRHGAEMIYSTGGPWSAHIAASLCAGRTGLPWIAEFQDPLVGDWMNQRKNQPKLGAWVERYVNRRADAVVYMTERALKEAENRTSVNELGHFIYPGAPVDLFDDVLDAGSDQKKFVMGHFGSFGGDRNAGSVLKAVSELVSEYPSARDDIRLMLVGDMDRAQETMLDEFEHQEMLDIRGKLSREEALRGMLECNMLLLIQNASSQSRSTIPSKAYEYMHAQVPILGLTYDNPELDSMLTDLGHSSIDLRNTEEIYDAIERAYDLWKESGTLAKPRQSEYTTSFAASNLVDIADLVKQNRKKSTISP